MKYKDSKKILRVLKKSKRILVNVHRSPDPDSLGSALSFYEYLTKLKKEVKVICPDNLSEDHLFLPYSEKVEKVNFRDFDFSKWDTFLVLDSSSWDMVTGKDTTKIPGINLLVIDHHITSTKFGTINLIDEVSSSTAEIVYFLFKDCKVRLTKSISQNLLAGIICDTGIFQYPNVNSQTLEVVRDLMLEGADKNKIVENFYRNYPFSQLKLWGEILKGMEFDRENRFIYSAISYDIYKKYDEPESGKETSASMFSPIVKDSDFGMIMIEEERDVLSVSFRSKKDFDVSKVAKALGGGGHILASGATLRNMEFEKAVEKVLSVVKQYAQKNN
ncbi:MAG: bifunctional oligoribonuclease/PAP phosphatase NrnA [Patescibacteria group bacterium]